MRPRSPVNRAKVTLQAGEVYWCEQSVTDGRTRRGDCLRRTRVRMPELRKHGYNRDHDSLFRRDTMRIACQFICCFVVGGFIAGTGHAQAPAASEETNRIVAGGGISVPGWQGKIDA